MATVKPRPITDADIQQITEILGRHTSVYRALPEIHAAMGWPVNPSAIGRMMRRLGYPTMSRYLADLDAPLPDRAPAAQPPLPPPPEAPPWHALFAKLKGRRLSLEQLCDELDTSPRRAKALIDTAREQGVALQVADGAISIPEPEPDDSTQQVGIPPVVGQPQTVAVLSDLHCGSKYCLTEQAQDFVHWARDRGATEVLCPGDLLDGHYEGRGSMFEVSRLGLEEQCAALCETLPQLEGLSYHGITGNHEETFWARSGVDVGATMVRYFNAHDRDDLHIYGARGAFLELRGVRIHLWHPRTGKAYARSYHLQRLVQMYQSGEKPDIHLAGHWHIFNYCVERGVHLIACPCFQGGGSAFSRSLGGSPELGGLLLTWELTQHGTIRTLAVERRAYYEQEGPHRVEVGPGVHEGLPA